VLISNIKKLLVISRPISWPNTAYPFAAGYLVSGGHIDALFVVATLYFLIPYNLLMYGVNDVFDYESDIRNPRKGGIEGAVEQKAFHPTIIAAVLLTNIPFVAWILWNGTVLSGAVFVTLLFFVVAYSIAKLRFKEIPVLDSITSSIHFVGPLVFALSITGLSMVQLPFAVAFFLWGAASHAFGAVQDVIPDREGKLASVATVFGARVTTRIVFGLYLLSSFLIIMQGPLAAVVGVAGLIYAANVYPYLLITDETSGKANRGWRRFIWLNLFTGFVVTVTLIVGFWR
jgi:4-hydroxybenzoate polyprenyltransferase